jgi:hypothetical protein
MSKSKTKDIGSYITVQEARRLELIDLIDRLDDIDLKYSLILVRLRRVSRDMLREELPIIGDTQDE